MFDRDTLDVIVTNTCADTCAQTFGLNGRDEARAWLVQLIVERGFIADHLPAPMSRRRSPSGYFLLIDGLLALPLAEGHDRDGRSQWIATNCVGFPVDRSIDPLSLHGHELLAHVNFTVHAIQRFQQRGGGDLDQQHARFQLTDRLAPTARASSGPPDWWRSAQPALFYLIAGTADEYCLPCRAGDARHAFEATTFMHRAAHLFECDSTDLTGHCRLDPHRLPPGSRTERHARQLLHRGGKLSWHRPSFVDHPDPRTKWWLHFSDKIAAPIAWAPNDEQHPLIILDVSDGRHWWRRIIDRH
ncbi:hypothetical protein [Nocardia vulneris]|uniref:hypothetical protein n=1 Tax=Nocardia vulneris TaxID=1141657 RepID=UPI000AAEB38A|nr:hypothetical protein [Nocardia vulneris]